MRQFQDQPLQKPTVELVRAEGHRFGLENKATENALTELVKKFPKNSEESHVLLKVAAINQLYSTQIYAVRILAAHIVSLNIDAQLDAGSVGLVDRIASVEIRGKIHHNLSFASKYCSWHRPENYPTYDSYAERCLWAHRQQFGLSFARQTLWKYSSFVDAVTEFRDRFELQTLSFKEIDKFLYLNGAALIEAQEKAKAAVILSETVLEIGAEGGLIALRERRVGEDWRFHLKTNETALYELLSEEDRNSVGESVAQTGNAPSFNEALVLLDRYPTWFSLSPLKVHPEFLEKVMLEVRLRDGPTEETRWRAALK